MGKTRELTSSEIDEIKNDLLNGISKKKKSSVRKIGKFLINELANVLLDSFINLKKTPKNWEMQSEMIKSLGLLKVPELLPFVEVILKENLEDNMITLQATKAFIRVKSKNKEEIKFNIFKFLNEGGRKNKSAALAILASENLILTKEEMHLIIDLVDRDMVYIEDSFYLNYLISAMSSWPKEISSPIFEKYTNDKRIIQAILKGAKKGRNSYSDY